jgi:hypothetical protein
MTTNKSNNKTDTSSKNDYEAMALNAAKSTDRHFALEMAGLTKLTTTAIEELIFKTGIDKEALIQTIRLVQDATKSNTEKAKAILHINKGLEVVLEIAGAKL